MYYIYILNIFIQRYMGTSIYSILLKYISRIFTLLTVINRNILLNVKMYVCRVYM